MAGRHLALLVVFLVRSLFDTELAIEVRSTPVSSKVLLIRVMMIYMCNCLVGMCREVTLTLDRPS